MAFRNIIWWLCFTTAGIWLENFVSGVDFLAPGLLISLQEERRGQTVILALAFILIQEGGGSLAFGSGILWYAALVVLHYLGRWLFEAENILFVVIVGLLLGVWHLALIHVMSSLQDLALAQSNLIRESLIQAISFPLVWAAAVKMRGKRERDVVVV